MAALRSKPSLLTLLAGAGLLVGWWLEPGLFAGSPGKSGTNSRVQTTQPHQAQVDDKHLMAGWNNDIKPMLEHYCYDCHGDGHRKGKLDMDVFTDLASMRANPAIWEHIQARIDYHLMPPPDKEQPPREKRNLLIAWINDAIFPVDPNNPDPGHVVLRRMNRVEYQNTIRDLLGVGIDAVSTLPPDDSGFGFDNMGSVLTISPAHIEKYLHTAELALNKALVIGPMKAAVKKCDPRGFRGDGRRDESGVYLFTRGTVSINPSIDRAGTYRLHVIASAQQAGDEPAFLDVGLKGKIIKRFKVGNDFGDEKTYSVDLKLNPGKNDLKLTFPNDFYDPKARDPNRRDRNLMIHGVHLEGPTNVVYEKPKSHQSVFITRQKDASDQLYARHVLTHFARKAFRRPAQPGEISRYLRLVESITRKEQSLELGIKGALQAMLVSPSFLFIGIDESAAQQNKKSSSLVSEHTLASRLSYFLWSSMPDSELLELADHGQLRANLDHQLTRMLKDDKAQQMVKNFSGQWLQLRDLAVITPDPKRFRSFTDALRNDMLLETEMLVDHILRGNKSLLDFLDADYSFINDRLAYHYQIDGVKGSQFRRVKLDHSHRRGILTHASLLTITSQPTRTSPVLRGKFVLENILDITPPPPPPDTQPLQDPREHAEGLTLREQLAIHREKNACAGCHNLMDPVGLAFEHYDAIGRYREFANGRAIDASGRLVTGEPLENAESLRKVISGTKRDAFIRCLTVKMMTYALGRGVNRYDRLTIEKILRDIKKKDYSSQALIRGIVLSTPFQHQRR
ncbi:MAG: DUF1592 domain-containing protein [Akkermansiaceae bacterium]|nr:DUF1592 domain-containing protein [Akkermansiaceae bacterium]